MEKTTRVLSSRILVLIAKTNRHVVSTPPVFSQFRLQPPARSLSTHTLNSKISTILSVWLRRRKAVTQEGNVTAGQWSSLSTTIKNKLTLLLWSQESSYNPVRQMYSIIKLSRRTRGHALCARSYRERHARANGKFSLFSAQRTYSQSNLILHLSLTKIWRSRSLRSHCETKISSNWPRKSLTHIYIPMLINVKHRSSPSSPRIQAWMSNHNISVDGYGQHGENGDGDESISEEWE